MISEAASRLRTCQLDTPSTSFLYSSTPSIPAWRTPMPKHLLAVFLISVSATYCSAQENWKSHQPKLTPQQSGTTQLLIAVSPVDSRVVWAGGTGGTYVVTTDGGEHWKAAVVPGAENDQFRDVHGVSDKVAYLMSIGNNTTDFKVYKTVDGGAH